MKRINDIKMILDMGILAVSCLFAAAAFVMGVPETVLAVSVTLAVLVGGAALVDIFHRQRYSPEKELAAGDMRDRFTAYELILLDENDKPVKSWDLTGQTSMIVGRKNKDEEVDVDLSNCEYSALIDIQHAVLNFCLDSWYLEDLDSHNGVKIRKIEDGVCYRLTQNRPCRIMPGDVIYISRTKLLFT